MFYYAEIDSEYLVINTHSLTEASSNSSYILITEEEYNSGDLIGMHYNSLHGRFETMDWDEWVCSSLYVGYNSTNMPLSTRVDNLQAEINALSGSDGDEGNYASADDLQVLTDIVNTKADADHSHDEYALSSHSHDDTYYTELEIDEQISSISNTVAALSSTVSSNYDESIIGLSIDGKTITYIKGDGSSHTFETQDTNTTYSLGTDEVTGLTKLYATTGSAEDGTMTQKAIKTELDKKVGVSVDDSQNILIFTI